MKISRGDLVQIPSDDLWEWAKITGREDCEILQGQIISGKYIAIEREKIMRVIPCGKILYRPPDEDD